MKVIISYYSLRTSRLSIDFECLMRIAEETFPDCTEITFTEMSPSEKREAEGDTDAEFGITDIVSPEVAQISWARQPLNFVEWLRSWLVRDSLFQSVV